MFVDETSGEDSNFHQVFQAAVGLLFHLHGFATSMIAIPLAFLPFV